MQQILAGMTELNERAQNAEARATEGERQAQATQQGLARSQAVVKGKGKQCHYNRSKGSARLRRSTSLSRSKARTTSGENGLEFFRSWSGRFFGVALAEVFEHVEGYRNDSATILDLALTSLRFDAGLLRNIPTELHHVLIMLTRGRAQRLVLKAAEPEGLEAYRLLLRRYEPVSNGHDSFETCGSAGNHFLWRSHGFFDRFLATSHVLGA